MRYLNLILLSLLLLGFSACGEHNEYHDHGDDKQEEEVRHTEDVNAKLAELGIELPALTPPVANYVHSVRAGKLVYTAGKGPTRPEGGYVTGKLGVDLTVEEGYAAARLAAIQLLAALKAELGDLNEVKRIVKVTGMVNAGPDFTDQPEVVNGCSDLLVSVFGDRGKHARAAVGMGSLPRNIAVEIELVAETY